MARPDPVVAVPVLAVLAVALASGPLVGAVDLTAPERGTDRYAGGTLTATAVRLPADGVRIERGEYGSGAYYLRAPDAVVRLSAVSGHPRLVYKLRLPALGYVTTTTTFLGPEDAGTVRLRFAAATLEPDRVTRDRYRGELLVVFRSGTRSRVLASRNVTVPVTG